MYFPWASRTDFSHGADLMQTPALGINIDASSVVKTLPAKLNVVSRPIPWLKTVIEQDKRQLYYHWPSDSQG